MQFAMLRRFKHKKVRGRPETVPLGNQVLTLENRQVPKIQLQHNQIAGSGVNLIDRPIPRAI